MEDELVERTRILLAELANNIADLIFLTGGDREFVLFLKILSKILKGNLFKIFLDVFRDIQEGRRIALTKRA